VAREHDGKIATNGEARESSAAQANRPAIACTRVRARNDFSSCPGNRVLEQKPLFRSNTCTAICAFERPLTRCRQLWITAPGALRVTYNRAALKRTCPQ